MPTSPDKLLNNDHGNSVFATYTGHTFDTVTHLYFAEARFYDAGNRNWISRDPAKDGLNWYEYCASNPTSKWDPLGLTSANIMVNDGGKSAKSPNSYYSKISSCENTNESDNLIYNLLFKHLKKEPYPLMEEQNPRIVVTVEALNLMVWKLMKNKDNHYENTKFYSGALRSLIEKKLGNNNISVKDVEIELGSQYPWSAYMGFFQRDRAIEFFEGYFGYSPIAGDDGTQTNAFFHAYWSAFTSFSIGSNKAKIFTTAHEIQSSASDYDVDTQDGYTIKEHTYMDLHNNNIGIEIEKSMPFFPIQIDNEIKKIFGANDEIVRAYEKYNIIDSYSLLLTIKIEDAMYNAVPVTKDINGNLISVTGESIDGRLIYLIGDHH